MNAPRHLGHRVRILSQAIRQAIDRKLCDLDLTGQQSFIIRYLSERQGEVVYPKDIERRFNLTHPTVSGLLQRLESKGFLTCEPDPDDRRYKRIVLTEKAAECQKEIWQHIRERKDGESIMYSTNGNEKFTNEDEKLLAEIETVKQIVVGIRAVRAEKNIAPREELQLNVVNSNVNEKFASTVKKMAKVNEIQTISEKDGLSASFMVGTTEYAVPLGNLIDKDAEKAKANAELEHLEKFLASIEKKLSNEKFTAHAPEKVVEMERKKLCDTQSKIATIKETLKNLG